MATKREELAEELRTRMVKALCDVLMARPDDFGTDGWEYSLLQEKDFTLLVGQPKDGSKAATTLLRIPAGKEAEAWTLMWRQCAHDKLDFDAVNALFA